MWNIIWNRLRRLEELVAGLTTNNSSPIEIDIGEYGIDLWSIVFAGGGSISIDDTDLTKQFWQNVLAGKSRGVFLLSTNNTFGTIRVAAQTLLALEQHVLQLNATAAVMQNEVPMFVHVFLNPTTISGGVHSGIAGSVIVAPITST